MSFNRSTWSADLSARPGLKKLAAAAAQAKGFSPKHAPPAAREAAPKARRVLVVKARLGRHDPATCSWSHDRARDENGPGKPGTRRP